MAQLVHAAAPVFAAYVPTAHALQLLDEAPSRVAEYSPAAHAVHATEPVEVAYAPSPHAKQAALPDALAYWPPAQPAHGVPCPRTDVKVPNPHPIHTVDADAPVTVEYSPRAQPTQPEDPVTDAYAPAWQLEHTLALPIEYSPARQLAQAVDNVADDEYVPARHAVHVAEAVAPTPPENVPAGQLVQLDEDAPPVVEAYVPAAHSAHCADATAPVTTENKPAAQPVHALDAAADAKAPAAQDVHVPAPVPA